MLIRLTEPEISIFTFGLLEIKLFIIAGVKLSNKILVIFKFETVFANFSVFASTTTILFSLIALVIILTQSTSIADQCNYKTQTVTENGVIVHRTEVKTCEETKQIGKKSFLIEFMNDERFEDIMLLSMIFIFENL